MRFDVGNVQLIVDPSAEQVRHFLRFMPPEAPFVVLSADDGSFMQAVFAGEHYRVEYRTDKRLHVAHLPFQEAAEALEAFRRGDESYRESVAWRRVSLLNDLSRRASLIVLAGFVLLVVVALFVWGAYLELR
jgi:hypothetical protein